MPVLFGGIGTVAVITNETSVHYSLGDDGWIYNFATSFHTNADEYHVNTAPSLVVKISFSDIMTKKAQINLQQIMMVWNGGDSNSFGNDDIAIEGNGCENLTQPTNNKVSEKLLSQETAGRKK